MVTRGRGNVYGRADCEAMAGKRPLIARRLVEATGLLGQSEPHPDLRAREQGTDQEGDRQQMPDAGDKSPHRDKRAVHPPRTAWLAAAQPGGHGLAILQDEDHEHEGDHEADEVGETLQDVARYTQHVRLEHEMAVENEITEALDPDGP